MSSRFLVSLLITLTFTTYGKNEMSKVNPALFLPDLKMNFDSIAVQNEVLKKGMVEYLFDNDMIDHVGTKAYAANSVFLDYYRQFNSLYRLIDLNKDGIAELVFNGFATGDEGSEMLEIYCSKNGTMVNLYKESGNLMAYKIQVNTGEILLYHHKYPCCTNASHNLNRLRLVGEKLHLLKRFFVGRESKDMVGPFFPTKTIFSNQYYTTEKSVKLFWSPEVITKNAWIGRTQKNTIASYDSLSVYKILAEEKSWCFVLMKNSPRLEENVVINPMNFKETWVYGWLKK